MVTEEFSAPFPGAPAFHSRLLKSDQAPENLLFTHNNRQRGTDQFFCVVLVNRQVWFVTANEWMNEWMKTIFICVYACGMGSWVKGLNSNSAFC